MKYLEPHQKILLILVSLLIAFSVWLTHLEKEEQELNDRLRAGVCAMVSPVPLHCVYVEPHKVEEVTAEEPTPVYEFTADEEMELMKLAMSEGRGTNTYFKALVMRVVLNQFETGNYGSTIHEVIHYKNNYSVVKSGRFDAAVPDAECYEALELIRFGWDESQGATHFRTTDLTGNNWHDRNLTHLFDSHGGSFYKIP